LTKEDIVKLKSESDLIVLQIWARHQEEQFRAFKKAQDEKPIMLYPQIGAKYVDTRTQFCAELTLNRLMRELAGTSGPR
jgi:hypothetical protein